MSVFWTRGYRREGKTLDVGLVVVRAGWVAFLPLGIPFGPRDQFALGATRARGPALRMDVPWQGRYPIGAWWQHGERVFDEEVRRALAQPGAAMLTNAEAGFVARKYVSAFVPFAPGTPMITLDQAPPPVLALSWRPGVFPFDAKKALLVTSLVTGGLLALGALFTFALFCESGELNPVPLAFFGVIDAIVWIIVAKGFRDHRREVAAQAHASPVGPYR